GDRERAVRVFCLLVGFDFAGVRVSRAKSALISLCQDPDRHIRDWVQSTLVWDRDQRALRVKLARQGSPSAMEAILRFEDPEEIEVLRKAGVHWALRRHDALKNGTWEAPARKVILGDESDYGFDFHWACRTAKRQR